MSIRKGTNFSEKIIRVIYSLYHLIFIQKFNFRFGHPATDTCGTCGSDYDEEWPDIFMKKI